MDSTPVPPISHSGSAIDGISPEDLSFLSENVDRLSPEMRSSLHLLLRQRQTGCRTNHWMNRVRPHLHPKQKMFLSLDHREVMFGGAAGGAKAMLLLTPCNAAKLGYDCSKPSQLEEFRMQYAQNVLTPFGFKPIDDIKVGDAVCNPDGSTASVIATHYPGRKKCYEIEFHDGAKCIVSGDHQWAMKISGKRTRRKVADPYSSEYSSPQERFNMELMRRYKSSTTSNMIVAFRWAEAQKSDGVRPDWPLIPLTEPVNTSQGTGRTSMCPPYTLGVLLGDGKISQDGQASWSKPDYFIADAVRSEIAAWNLTDTVSDHANGESHGICGGRILNCLRSLNLMGTVSGTKFIPMQYRNGPIQMRTTLIQGLMDTDGHVDSRGQCYYSTASKQLADDVQYILRSLGYTATVSVYEEPTYTHNGEKKIGQPSYRTYVSGRNRSDLFRLPRKQNLITELNNEGGRRVVAIRDVGDDLDVKCITVSHPNGLYITNDFIVTHNSDSLLLSMMQYLDIPGYCSIIFRRTFKDLSGAGSIMDRAKSWFAPLEDEGVKWSSSDNSFYFPTGKGQQPSRFAFAYLQHDDDKRNYQGWELNACAFDELTQHPRESYSYLFSRLRRLKGSGIPVRMRSATNPGGKFGDWVREEFIPDEYLALADDPDRQFSRVWEKKTDCGECHGTGMSDLRECLYCEGLGHRTRLFVPSRIQDNPSIDMAEYLRSLINLPPVERYRLEKGDWLISELGNIFRPEWLRYYTRRGEHFTLHRPDQPDLTIAIQELTFFVTADTASKEKTSADFTCISTWAFHQRSGNLILIHTLMTRMEVPRIAEAILNQSSASNAMFVMVEEAQCGIGIIQELRGPKGRGIAVNSYNPSAHRDVSGRSDKIARSTTAQIKMESGQIYFPSGNPGWLTDPFAQMVGFPQATHDDFVDTLTMACHWAHSRHQIGSGGIPGILPPVGRYLSSEITRGLPGYGNF